MASGRASGQNCYRTQHRNPEPS